MHRGVVRLGQVSYVMLLIAMTVVMAAALVAFAIAFDIYVIKSEGAFSNLNLQNTASDLADGNIFGTIISQFQRLV